MNSSVKKKSMYFFAAPALSFYLLFWIFPIMKLFQYSVSDYNGFDQNFNYIGLENFKTLFRGGVMTASLTNTLIYAFVCVVLGNIIALCLALVLNIDIYGKGFYRSIFYIPTLFSTIVIGFIWSYVYMPEYGLIPTFLKSIGIQAASRLDLLGNYRTALYAIIAVDIWKNIGQSTIIFLAGLQTIPKELLEAAQIDGCNSWQLNRRVRIPMLAASITVNVTLTTINSLKAFDYPFIMTNGGPGKSTNTLMYTMYQYAFRDQNFGMASALGIISFTVIIAITAVLVINLRKKEVNV